MGFHRISPLPQLPRLTPPPTSFRFSRSTETPQLYSQSKGPNSLLIFQKFIPCARVRRWKDGEGINYLLLDLGHRVWEEAYVLCSSGRGRGYPRARAGELGNLRASRHHVGPRAHFCMLW